MQRDALVDAAQRALLLRGTVMLALDGDPRRWCAICAAVDGSVELRVGEPPRGWLRRRPAAGESWLRAHGFVHVIDAWSAPAPFGAGARVCAELLASALREGLGVPDDGELVEVLVHPGLIGDAEPPAPTAPHAEHIGHALAALADRRRGKVSFQGGRPAATWAWVFTLDRTLGVSPEPIDNQGDYSRDWTVGIDGADLTVVADELATLLHGDPGRSPSDPLFITFMDV